MGATEGIAHEPLEDWFRKRVPEIEPPLDYEKIHGGLSNLTYLVTDQAGSRWVLRRPPLGKRLGSAHDMGREVKVVTGLSKTSVPVPPLVGYCEDEEVTGAPFYAMEFVEGPVLRSPVQAALFPKPEQRRHIGEQLIDTLVAIHSVNPDQVGLGDLGRRKGYAERQLQRWSRQWEQSKTRDLPLVDEVHERLSGLVPAQHVTTLVHGDYRLDNVILSPTGEIAAVVDWELCTLGDPLADLGLLMVYWIDPGSQGVPLLQPATTEPGFPTGKELAERYAEVSGRDISDLDFFVALGYWKLAIILEGVLARFTAGQYGSGQQPGPELEETIQALARAAAEAADRVG